MTESQKAPSKQQGLLIDLGQSLNERKRLLAQDRIIEVLNTTTIINFSGACVKAGIHPCTGYKWRRLYKDFEEKVFAAMTEADNKFCDFAESALVKKINTGDSQSIIFALKTRGKNRGYGEIVEHNHQGEIGPVTLTVNFV